MAAAGRVAGAGARSAPASAVDTGAVTPLGSDAHTPQTVKRDYAWVNPLPDAGTVISLIGNRIDKRNENHPHSALKWPSPREFRSTRTKTAWRVFAKVFNQLIRRC